MGVGLCVCVCVVEGGLELKTQTDHIVQVVLMCEVVVVVCNKMYAHGGVRMEKKIICTLPNNDLFLTLCCSVKFI